MEYTDDDWDASKLRKKYQRDANVGIEPRELYLARNEVAFGYEQPQSLRNQCLMNYHTANKSKRLKLEYVIRICFYHKCSLYYDHILFPVMRLNTEEQELEDKINRVNKLRDEVGTGTTANHNGNLLFAVNNY